MANYTGEGGAVTIIDTTDSAGETNIAEVRSWTVEHTKDVIEDTVMGDAARTYKHGLHQFTGSMEVVYEDSHNSAKAFDPASDTDLTVTFYAAEASGGSPKFSGNILVTSVSRTASFDDLVTATVNFQGSGALTIGTV
jgi:predicted secreted protein